MICNEDSLQWEFVICNFSRSTSGNLLFVIVICYARNQKTRRFDDSSIPSRSSLEEAIKMTPIQKVQNSLRTLKNSEKKAQCHRL